MQDSEFEDKHPFVILNQINKLLDVCLENLQQQANKNNLLISILQNSLNNLNEIVEATEVINFVHGLEVQLRNQRNPNNENLALNSLIDTLLTAKSACLAYNAKIAQKTRVYSS